MAVSPVRGVFFTGNDVPTVLRRAHLLVLALCLVVAGCAGAGVPAEPDSTTTGTTAACVLDVPSERAPPDLPGNLTRDRAAEFVAAYGEAATWNRLVEAGKGSVAVHVDRATVIDQTAGGYVVRAEGGGGFADCLDGRRVAGDLVVNTTYFVNGSALVRLPDGNASDSPQARGTVVERWG
jgi:hypothetical protein